MTKYTLARQLSGKRIYTNEGEDFGRLVDLAVNEVTGKIEALVVEGNPDSEMVSKLHSEEGMVHVNYESVLAVGDIILVDKRNLAY